MLDGQVNSIWQFGDKVVIGGTFTRVANSTTNGGAIYNRAYLAAFNATTGVIDPNFDPVAGPDSRDVEVIIPSCGSGTRSTSAATFNTVDGANRLKVARLEPERWIIRHVVQRERRRRHASATSDSSAARSTWPVCSPRSVARRATYLASLDPATGALTSKVDLDFAGLQNGGVGKVIKIEVTPDGNRMLIIGNFTSIDGQPRGQVALIDLAATPPR